VAISLLNVEYQSLLLLLFSPLAQLLDDNNIVLPPFAGSFQSGIDFIVFYEELFPHTREG
jgi:hypothetical protein